jgi:hypothetical protein
MLQVVGSLLAIPVGLASAYSIYRANFSVETTCQSLRAGIVSMLNKSVDAAAQRMLVRRDVEAFEQTCRTVDPDATAAFKVLLATEKTAAAPAIVAAPVTPKLQRSETLPKEPVRKVEPRPQQAAKQPPAITAPAVAAPAPRDRATSDTQWLDAVRQAMAAHSVEALPAEAGKPDETAPATRPAQQAIDLPTVASIAAAPAPIAAPIVLVPAEPAAPRSDVDHPVPPGAIPDPADAAAAKPNEQERSRIGKWIAKIPLVNTVVENAWR